MRGYDNVDDVFSMFRRRVNVNDGIIRIPWCCYEAINWYSCTIVVKGEKQSSKPEFEISVITTFSLLSLICNIMTYCIIKWLFRRRPVSSSAWIEHFRNNKILSRDQKESYKIVYLDITFQIGGNSISPLMKIQQFSWIICCLCHSQINDWIFYGM